MASRQFRQEGHVVRIEGRRLEGFVILLVPNRSRTVILGVRLARPPSPIQPSLPPPGVRFAGREDSKPRWGNTSKRTRIMSVQSALNWCAEMEYLGVTFSPIAKMRKPLAERRDNLVTPEEWETIVGKIKSPQFRALLTVAWETGMRPQELARANVEEYDPTSGQLTFTLKNSKGKKGKKRVRVVHLTTIAKSLIETSIAGRKSGPIFINRDGRRWNPSSVNCQMRRLKERIGKTTAMAVSGFRHSFVTRMIKAGVDLITVANLCGHVDATMIAKVYAHLADHAHLKDALRRGNGQSKKGRPAKDDPEQNEPAKEQPTTSAASHDQP